VKQRVTGIDTVALTNAHAISHALESNKARPGAVTLELDW